MRCNGTKLKAKCFCDNSNIQDIYATKEFINKKYYWADLKYGDLIIWQNIFKKQWLEVFYNSQSQSENSQSPLLF